MLWLLSAELADSVNPRTDGCPRIPAKCAFPPRLCRVPEPPRRPVADPSVTRLITREGGRDPGALFVVLRAKRPPARAVRVAHPAAGRSLGASYDGRHAAAQAVLPGRAAAATAAAHLVPEVLQNAGHRRGRDDRAPLHLLRDARQLLLRRLLQAGSGRVRHRAVGQWL